MQSTMLAHGGDFLYLTKTMRTYLGNDLYN
jgi:hypothetical protein